MKLLASGSDTGKNIYAGAVDAPLNGTTTNFVNSSIVNGLNIKVLANLQSLTVGAVITYQVKVGAGAATAKNVSELSGSFTVTDALTQWQSKEIAMSRMATSWDTLEISFQSDNANDTNVTINAEIYNLDMVDENGRVDVGLWLGSAVTKSANNLPDVNVNEILDTTPSLTNSDLDVNVTQTGGATPLTAAVLAAAVLEKLIADHSGTAGSLAEFVSDIKVLATAIDTLTKASGGGDLAAILEDTGTTIPTLLAKRIALETTIADDNPDGSDVDMTFTLAAGSTNDDEYNNMVISVTDVSGSVTASRRVTDYAQATKKVTVDNPFEFPIAIGDTVIIWADTYSTTAGAAAASEIADAVLDEAAGDHRTAGTIGNKINQIEGFL